MQRLKSRAQFQAILTGNTVARTPHFALHQLVLPDVATSRDTLIILPPPEGLPAGGATLPELFPHAVVWMGAMVPKRWAKRAVTRNAIKRQIYTVTELFAPQMQRLPVAAYVLRLRSGFDRKQFVSATSDALKLAVRTELQQLMARLLVQRNGQLRTAPFGIGRALA